MRRVHCILVLAAIAACTGYAKDFDLSAFQDAQKVSGLLKAGFQSRFEGGPLNNGTAVYNLDRDLAFWVKDGAIYAVNDRARAAAPGQPPAPAEITYAAVYDASAANDLELEMRPSMISVKGFDMPGAEARALEEALQQHPEDLWARTTLLGYYNIRQFTSDNDKKVREQHVLWLLTNVPEAAVVGCSEAELDPTINPSAYPEAARILKACVDKDPQNLRLLRNAAEFFHMSDKAYAEECLKRCTAIEPDNPRWHDRLASIHYLEARSPGVMGFFSKADPDAGKKAKAEQDRALELTTDPMKKTMMLQSMAERALHDGDMEEARKCAAEMLESPGSRSSLGQGQFINSGNSLLGRIALEEGDTAKAREYLIAAGKCNASPLLSMMGPDMQLAAKLLKRGERDAVIQYLELCGGFWRKNVTDKWIKEIQSGQEPDMNPLEATMAEAGVSMPGLPSSFAFEGMPEKWDTPLLTLTMPTERLRNFDALYGVPLLLLLATVLWVRLFSNWQHLWILAPLAVVYVVPITLAYCMPPLSEMLFGLGGGSVQHLVSTYFGGLALLWLLSDLLARTKTWAVAPAAIVIMGLAGVLGTVNYPHRFHMLAEIITFIVVVTASFALARVCSPGKYSAKRFFSFLFVFNVALMLVTWIPLWSAMQLFIFHTPPFELLFHLHQHVLISLVNGVGLFAFLVPFLLLASYVSLYREQFRKVLRIESE